MSLLLDLAPGWNSSFSRQLPALQLAWDSTSMGTLKECPRKYYYTILRGFTRVGGNVHLEFGLWYHGALERYDHGKADGLSHDGAVDLAVDYVLKATWNSALKRPWLSDDPNKNRMTLLRTVVWYLDQFQDDICETIILDNGKPAVELSFRMPLGIQSATGEDFLLCGHLDRLVKFQDMAFVMDRKTTKSTVGPAFFAGFNPDNQFSTYITASKVVFHTPVQGLIVDAAQVAVTFSRFERSPPIIHTEDSTAEWMDDLFLWLAQAQAYAQMGRWPKNEKSCNNYGGCQFRFVCAKTPGVREQWLTGQFGRRVWDPLQVRGDI